MFRRMPLAICMLWVLASLALGGEAATRKTGSDFRRQLDEPTGVAWTGDRQLRDALDNLAEARQVALLLDRRVDPNQTIEFRADASLEVVLRQLAARLELGVAIFDGTVYLGPAETARELATVAAQQHEVITGLSEPRRRILTKLPPLATEPLATPRDLILAWADECSLELVGADKIPHDLWPALNLPSQSAASRATLLLAGFNLAIEISPDGAQATIVPLPRNARLTRTYAGGPQGRDRARQIGELFPEADIELASGKLVIAARFEDHDQIARLLSGHKIRRVEATGGEKRFTLDVTNQPIGAILRAVAGQSKLEVDVDPAVQDRLQERVSFSVKEVTLDDLLEKTLAPAGIAFEVKDGRLRLTPAKE